MMEAIKNRCIAASVSSICDCSSVTVPIRNRIHETKPPQEPYSILENSPQMFLRSKSTWCEKSDGGQAEDRGRAKIIDGL